MTRHVHIELPAMGTGPAKVEVEGADISAALRAIEIFAGVSQPTDVRLQLAATPITFNGTAHLWLPAAVVDLLAEYGWACPPHAERDPSGGVRLTRPEPVVEP